VPNAVHYEKVMLTSLSDWNNGVLSMG